MVDLAVTALRAIDGTGDYQTTLAVNAASGLANVEDSRPNWDQKSGEMPAISVLTGQVDPEDSDDEARQTLRKMPLRVQGFLHRGTDASAARRFVSDIQRVLRGIGDQWIDGTGTPLAHRTDEGSHGIQYAETGFEITGVWQEVNIFYIASKLDMES